MKAQWTQYESEDALVGAHEGIGCGHGADPRIREPLLYDARGEPIAWARPERVGFK